MLQKSSFYVLSIGALLLLGCSESEPAEGTASPASDSSVSIDGEIASPDQDGEILGDVTSGGLDATDTTEPSDSNETPESDGEAEADSTTLGDTEGTSDSDTGVTADTQEDMPDGIKPDDGIGTGEESDTEPSEDTTSIPEPDTFESPDTEEGGENSTFLENCPALLEIVSPDADEFFALGTPVTLKATLSAQMEELPEGLAVQWEDPTGILYVSAPVEMVDGVLTSTASLEPTQATNMLLHARVVTSQGQCEEIMPQTIHICSFSVNEDFSTGITNGWNALDAASWVTNDTGQWVELTGNVTGQQGSLYNEAVTVSAGSASIRMTFATGGGVNTGADGLAMTVVDFDTVDELLSMISAAHSGGGLGYGVAGLYGDWEGDALHVEVDTWHNVYNGGSEFHTDPTSQNHVAIALNGDPGNDVWFEAIPTIEDLNWHTIQVDILGSTIKVWFDGNFLTETVVDGLEFRGGYIYFSASTGWATNFHRVDKLEVIHGCN